MTNGNHTGNGTAGQLETSLIGRLRANLNVDVPSADLDLIETGLIDSLTFVELLLLLEEEYGVTVDVADLVLDDFRSVQRIAAFITSRTVSAGGA